MNGMPPPPLVRDRRRALRVGVATLAAILALVAVSFVLQRQKNVDEAEIIAEANRELAAGLAGDCAAFRRAREGYFRAMKRHLQSKELAARSATAEKLAVLCPLEQSAAITARAAIVAGGAFTTDDVKTLALAQLAAGQVEDARATLAVAPDDAYAKWLLRWLGELGQE
jgi:hypothetical protein